VVVVVLAGVLGTVLAVNEAVGSSTQVDPSSPAGSAPVVSRLFRDIRFGRQVKLPAQDLDLSLPGPSGSDVDPRIFVPPRDTDTTFLVRRVLPDRCLDTGIFVTHVRGALKRQVPRPCLERTSPGVRPLVQQKQK
jgi:hypothetical protein